MTPVGPRWSKHLPTIGQRKGPALGEVQGPALFASNQPPGRGYWSVSDNGGHCLLFQGCARATVRTPAANVAGATRTMVLTRLLTDPQVLSGFGVTRGSSTQELRP